MTFAIFFEKTFWLIISLVSGLFVLITKLGYKSILADCETRSLLTEKNIREEFKKEFEIDYEKMFENLMYRNIEFFYEAVGWILRKPNENVKVDLLDFFSENDEIIELNYPVLEYPEKVKSRSFEKTPIIEGVLRGIKGQYLIKKYHGTS